MQPKLENQTNKTTTKNQDLKSHLEKIIIKQNIWVTKLNFNIPDNVKTVNSSIAIITKTVLESKALSIKVQLFVKKYIEK